MAGTIKTILLPMTFLTSLEGLIKVSRQHAVFPLYHAVSNAAPPHLKFVQKVRSVETFEKDLETLLKFYRPLSLKEYLSGSYREKERVMVLTFDDGLRECYEVVAPILKRKGIPAIFFLNTSFIDNRDLFFRYKASLLINHYCSMNVGPKEVENLLGVERRMVKQSMLKIDYKEKELLDGIANAAGFSFATYLRENPVYMNGDQVRSLIRDGFEIGSHSMDHPRFSRFASEEIREQIQISIDRINELFDTGTRYFSFPFSSDGIDPDVLNGLLESGRVDALMGTSGLKEYPDRRFIQRIPMEAGGWSAYRILKTEYLYYLLKAPFGKNLYTGG